jgi:hypothetical protein
MAEDHDAPAEDGAGGGNAGIELLIGQAEEVLRERLALADVAFLVFGQEVNLHFRS